MKTIVSVSACWVLFVFIHVEAAPDGDLQSVLARLSGLEEKQAFSEKRIAALEMENKMSQKRIVDLEKYKKLSDRRVAALERENALFNRQTDALDIEKELYAQDVALETDKILPDQTSTTNGYDDTLSDKKIALLQNDSAVSQNSDGEKDRHTAAVEITKQSTAGKILQFELRRFVDEGIVAFSAMKAAKQEHIGLNQNLIFEQVVTNEGGGYHANLGVFIAPQSGVYVFSSSIMCDYNGELQAEIVHNGNAVARLYAAHGDEGRAEQSSQTVVIKMNAGDEVAVRNIGIADNIAWGSLFSSFSGYLALMQRKSVNGLL